MSKTAIEWTDYSWNPWYGCKKVSAGCLNCYMYRGQRQYGKDPTQVVRAKTTFKDPLKWKETKRVFTCSWSDFFIEEADAWRDEAWEIIRQTPHLTYQILTKRPERMAGRLPWGKEVPWPNVWLGVSVENDLAAIERIPILLRMPAAMRFLSCEPLLGSVDLSAFFSKVELGPDHLFSDRSGTNGRIHWVIAGGESGPRARPMNPAWATGLRDQCVAAGVAFFFKQWGEWRPLEAEDGGDGISNVCYFDPSGVFLKGFSARFNPHMFKAGKKAAGCLLDGIEWKQFPGVRP